jgi:cleavage and polyadenylation specificity factor subunit 3
MNRLRSHLIRKFEDDPECKLLVYTPKNTQSVELRFRGEKTAKVVGQLAAEKPVEGNLLSGILVRRNFKLHMMAPEDLQSIKQKLMKIIFQLSVIFRLYNINTIDCHTTFRNSIYSSTEVILEKIFNDHFFLVCLKTDLWF